jgi:hypothetical protein
MPQLLYDVLETPGTVLVVSDADKGPIGGMVTRRDLAITYWYNRDFYTQQVQDGQAEVQSLFGPHDIPLFLMKAQVSKAFTRI